MRQYLKSVVVAIALLVPMVMASNARADGTVSVCNVSYVPPGADATFGTDGYLILWNTVGACGGLPGAVYFCSTNASNASCDLSYRYSEKALLELYSQLATAKRTAPSVYLYATGAKGKYVQF